MFWLKNRSIVKISGTDCKKFLQGLITNEIKNLEKEGIIYSAMLSPQGRFWFDFFIISSDSFLTLSKKVDEDFLLLDCHQSMAQNLIKKLNLYKIRSQIQISDESKLWKVGIDFDAKLNNHWDLAVLDPRNSTMGSRIYQKNSLEFDSSETSSHNFEQKYHQQRFALKIAEGFFDLEYDESFILAFGFDDISAVSYHKGCYLGQEPTARMHHRGGINKKLHHFHIQNPHTNLLKFISDQQKNLEPNFNFDADFSEFTILKNCEICLQNADKSIGKALSIIIQNGHIEGLALLKSDLENDQNEIGFLLKIPIEANANLDKFPIQILS